MGQTHKATARLLWKETCANRTKKNKMHPLHRPQVKVKSDQVAMGLHQDSFECILIDNLAQNDTFVYAVMPH